MKDVKIIGAPIKYGCSVDGADLSYGVLKNDFIKIIKPKWEKEIIIDYRHIKKIEHSSMKHAAHVMAFNKKLYYEVYSTLASDNFPLIIGGDHAIAIGSISAVLDYYKGDVSVIYFDKHTDIHTEKTSPSGNIHGIPLSACIGRCDSIFMINKYRLTPKNIFFLGICNYENEEINYINQEKIYNMKDYEITEDNIKNIIEDLKRQINTKYIHLSFDLDSIRDEDFHAVNVSMYNTYQDNKGLSFTVVKKLLKELLKNFSFSSMDFVEYNPLLDNDCSCKKKIETLLKIIKKNLH